VRGVPDTPGVRNDAAGLRSADVRLRELPAERDAEIARLRVVLDQELCRLRRGPSASSSVSRSAMSIPADTAAAVMIRRSRCSITRSSAGRGPVGGQIEVAGPVALSPSSRPTAPSTREPVQTEVVVLACAVRTQSGCRPENNPDRR
jgi:hypothetical protein